MFENCIEDGLRLYWDWIDSW